MAYRLVLDENLEREVMHRLEDYGHDVTHVDFVEELGKGSHDQTIGAYSQDTDRLIVTYDDDFVLEYDDSDYRAVIYFDDATLSAKEIADIVHAMSEAIPHYQIRGVEYAGSSWL